jgi:threonyl-tRNA synthetase
MSGVVCVRVFDGGGRELWSGVERDLPSFLVSIAGGNLAVGAMADPSAVPECSRNDVMRAAERLELVSRRGQPKGFLVILPAGRVFASCVEAFNVAHLTALDVVPVDFPLVFDGGGAAMADLIAPYHLQGRTFAIADRADLRLSYAADPSLFAWLAGRTLARDRLPFAVYSPQPVFRNFRTGELSIQRTRQFSVPDIHVLTHADDAVDRYLHALELAAESTRYWFGDDYMHMLDSVAGSTHDRVDFYARAAKAVGGVTVVRCLAARPKYYAQKSGLLVWSGYDNVMLYNLQLDEVNPLRFDMRLDDGGRPVVIHACVAMGVSRMLPLVLGRGLAEITPKTMPVALAPIQVTLIPVGAEHCRRVGMIADLMHAEGIRTAVDTDYSKTVGARANNARRAWHPFTAVVGDRDADELPLFHSTTRDGAPRTLKEFLREHGERIRRCAPEPLVWARRLPFVSAD